MDGERILMVVTPTVPEETLIEAVPPARLRGAELNSWCPQ